MVFTELVITYFLKNLRISYLLTHNSNHTFKNASETHVVASTSQCGAENLFSR